MSKQVLGKVLCNPKNKKTKVVPYFLFLSLLGGSIQLSLTSFLKSTLFSSYNQSKKANLVGGEQILQTKFPIDVTN